VNAASVELDDVADDGEPEAGFRTRTGPVCSLTIDDDFTSPRSVPA
jgi:hypothetical protein